MGINVDHRSFVIERELPGSPAHAFRFWSDHQLKRRWNSCHPDWTIIEDRFDFRVDGHESMIWRRPDGTEQVMLAHFLEFTLASVLSTPIPCGLLGLPFHLRSSLEFEGRDGRTTMTLTEQAVFASATDGDVRERGAGAGFARLQEAMMDFEEDTSS